MMGWAIRKIAAASVQAAVREQLSHQLFAAGAGEHAAFIEGTAPYMHDGRYLTVKELLTKGKHGNEDGRLERLSDQQIDDLAEYVLSQ
jgi:hypothetical protein